MSFLYNSARSLRFFALLLFSGDGCDVFTAAVSEGASTGVGVVPAHEAIKENKKRKTNMLSTNAMILTGALQCRAFLLQALVSWKRTKKKAFLKEIMCMWRTNRKGPGLEIASQGLLKNQNYLSFCCITNIKIPAATDALKDISGFF